MPRIRNATAIQPNAQQSREKEPAQSTLHEASIPPKKTLCRIWYPYRTLYGIVAIIVQAICVAIITQYSPSPTDPVRHPLPRHICFPGFHGSCRWSAPIPDAILQPSAALFTNAVMIYGLAAMALYGIFKDDRFHDYFLAFGICMGLILSGVVVTLEGAAGAMKDYMPVFITVTLLASSIFHRVYDRL